MIKRVHVLGAAVAAIAVSAIVAPAALAAAGVNAPVSPIGAGVSPDGLPWECNFKALEPTRQPDSVFSAAVIVCSGDFVGVSAEVCVARGTLDTNALDNYVPGFASRGCAAGVFELPPDAPPGAVVEPYLVVPISAACPPLTNLLNKSRPSTNEAVGAPWVTYVQLFGPGGAEPTESYDGNASSPAWIPNCGSILPRVSA